MRELCEKAKASVERVLKIVDVKIAPGLSVGYVNGVGDQVPPAIEQLGRS